MLFYVVFALMVIAMTAIFYVVMSRTSSLRLAIIAALFMGKAWALAMYLMGIDRPILRFYMINKQYPWVYREVVITANIVLTITYGISILVVIFMPKLSEYIPWLKEVRVGGK